MGLLTPTSFNDPILPGTPSNVSQQLLFGLKIANGKLNVAVTAVHWTKRDVIGKYFIAIPACMSCLAVAGLLSYLLVCTVRSYFASANSRARSIASFTQSDLGVYFLGLLTTDLLYSCGFAMELVPIQTYYTVHSTTCSLQGWAYAFGCTGNGLWNLAVAAQTFYVLVLGGATPSVVKWLVVTFIVVFQTCMTVVGPIISYRTKSPFPFYGPNPAGCYATVGPANWEIWYRAGPLVSVTCLGLMSAIYLVILGKILSVYKWREETTGKKWWSFGKGSRHQSSNDGSYGSNSPSGGGGSNEIGREGRRVAYLMQTYPLVYGSLTLPLTLSAIVAGFTATSPPQPFLAFAASCASAVGLCDTLLFLYTRKRLLLGKKKNGHSSKIHISSHKISRIEPIPLDSLPHRTFNTPIADLHLKPSDGMDDDTVSNESKAHLVDLHKLEVDDQMGSPRLQWFFFNLGDLLNPIFGSGLLYWSSIGKCIKPSSDTTQPSTSTKSFPNNWSWYFKPGCCKPDSYSAQTLTSCKTASPNLTMSPRFTFLL